MKVVALPALDIIRSPCIKNCCLDDQDICLGCFRTLDEICSWNSFTEQEKKAVLEHCQMRKQNQLASQQRKQHNNGND